MNANSKAEVSSLNQSTPKWETVRTYFGLDESYCWTTEQIESYTKQYLDSLKHENANLSMAEESFRLLVEADSYLREIRAENLDGSEPALGNLLDQITTLFLQREWAKVEPQNIVAEGNPATEFVNRMAGFNIWSWDNDSGEAYRECEEPSEGFIDSHCSLMEMIEEARKIQEGK